MELSRATITNTATNDEIEVMFNPEEYSVKKSNNFAEIGIPGLESPIIQFTRGGSRSISLDLFFDTYESGADVRTYTDKIAKLLKIDARTKAPPVCIFAWGSLVFNFVLVDVSKKFNMFLPNGVPVRATLSLTMKEYVQEVSAAGSPAGSGGGVMTHILAMGETMAGIASKYLGSPKNWRTIANANNVDNPRTMPDGTALKIPGR